MAYLDLTLAQWNPGTASAATPSDVSALFRAVGCSAKIETLTALEWRVIELARDDSLKTLLPWRKRSWLGRLIMGPTPPSRMLADERLEALRRLAVHAWHAGYTIPASAIRHAVRKGYSDLQIGSVIDTIVGRRLEQRGVAMRENAA
jgi:hypothetical protein